MVRIAIFAAIRSSVLDGESVGIMITASHNPECDNGIKLSDSNGGMLPIKWETMATQFANSDQYVLQAKPKTKRMIVHIGRDTRYHSLPLSQLAIRSLLAFGATVIDHGCVTTPALHYYVLRSNPHNMPNALVCGSSGTSFEKDYLESILGSYLSLLSTQNSKQKAEIAPNRQLLVDCACGVGGLKIPLLNAMLKSFQKEGGILLQEPLVDLVPINLPGDGPLNERCGAEYVQKQQQLPVIYSECDEKTLPTSYAASFDGDADRIVFHCKDSNGKLILLDGDKIAVLVSSFVQEEILALSTLVPEAKDVRCGIVQTAYANGSSTSYLKVSIRMYSTINDFNYFRPPQSHDA
jgi:phosphoacetylglucosamine mutase